MDYVKEEEQKRLREEAAEIERQRQRVHDQQRQRQEQRGDQDWAATMANTSMFEDALEQHLEDQTTTGSGTGSGTESSSAWPPLNPNSPWADYAQQSNAGKGSSRLTQSTSYSFKSWATETEKVLPPVSPDG